MFEVYRKEIEWGGRPLIMETGKIARQADGAVMVTYGDTVVLATAVAQKAPKPGVDFFPLIQQKRLLKKHLKLLKHLQLQQQQLRQLHQDLMVFIR
jgi:hypothetical protein